MNDLTLALQITAFGMGLVFAAILILWLMMTLLTTFTADKHASNSPEADPVSKEDVLAQAAAIGVAMAITEQQLSSAHPLKEPPTAIVSAWQLGMRTRQMTQKGEKRHR